MKIMASGPITSWQIDGKTMETVTDFIFLGSKITLVTVATTEDVCFLAGKLWQTKTVYWEERHYSADKGPYSQGCGLPSGHVKLWELDRKEGRASKNWCLWTVVLEKTLESSLDSKEIKPVNLKRNQPWIFIHWKDGAKAPILWPPDAKSQLIGKDPDTGKDWRQKKKRASEDAMTGWHLRSNGRELGQTPGDGEGHGGLACCSPWAKSWTWLCNWTTTQSIAFFL